MSALAYASLRTILANEITLLRAYAKKARDDGELSLAYRLEHAMKHMQDSATLASNACAFRKRQRRVITER